jgi:hypothetical protein
MQKDEKRSRPSFLGKRVMLEVFIYIIPNKKAPPLAGEKGLMFKG